MLSFNDLKVRNKIWLIIITALAGIGVIIFMLLASMKNALLEEKKMKTRHLVEAAHSAVEHYHQLFAKGAMTEQDARLAAIAAVRALRYQQSDYFWINDMKPSMVMHPYKPELEGKDLSDHKDPKGKKLFVEAVEAVKSNKQGFVYYLWPKPGFADPVKKVSFVKGFEPWGWIVGSGIYLDDVDALFWSKARQCGGVAVIIFLIILGVSLLISRSITVPLSTTAEVIGRIASGDLTRKVAYSSRNEIGMVALAINQMVDRIHELLKAITATSCQIAAASTQLKATSEHLAAGADELASQAGTVATASEEMAATSSEIAMNCASAAENSHRANDTATSGAAVVEGSVAIMKNAAERVKTTSLAVEKLGGQSERIGHIVGTIEDIADQTNLLALNAAIEAARAGEQGRGFAVVADEVRALAERTTKATREIAQMIKGVQKETQEVVSSMEEGVKEVSAGSEEASNSGRVLKGIIERINEVTTQLTQIATATGQQNSTTTEISSNMMRISDVVQDAVRGAEESATAATQLNGLACELQMLVGKFKLAA